MAPLRPTVIRFGRFGDMVMLTALTQALHQRYGTPCQVVGAGPWNADIFRAHPDVTDAWSLPRHLPLALNLTWPRVIAALHRSRPAPVYVCEPHERQLVRVRRLLKYGGVDPARCLFITDLAVRENEHCIDRLLRFGAQTPASLTGRVGASPAGRTALRACRCWIRNGVIAMHGCAPRAGTAGSWCSSSQVTSAA